MKRIFFIIIASSAIITAGGQSMHRDAAVLITPPDRARPLYSPDTLRISILGDVMMHTQQIHTAQIGEDVYDFSSYFKNLEDRINSADIVIANMEFTLAGKPYTGYPSFSAPDNFGEYLADCGFDIFLTANNHIFDKGGKGAERTLKMYQELNRKYGILVCGLADDKESQQKSMPLKIIRKGIRVSLINFTYGTNLGSDRHWPKTNYMSDNTLLTQALKNSEDCDLTIALPHWGNEYELNHSSEQERISIMLAENGADLIVGSHPHVPQDLDTVTCKNVPVAYSLGNAVSNMSAPNTQVGLMANISIVRECNGDVKMLPMTFTYLWCSRPGGYTDSYAVIPIKEYLGKKELWKGSWDYDKMISSYKRVRNIIGIEDK